MSTKTTVTRSSGRPARFRVVGAPMQSWTKGVTRSAMYVYLNAWFPSWLGGERPATDRVTSVDWIEYSGR